MPATWISTPIPETAADEYVTDAVAVNNLVIGAYNGLHNVMYYEWAVTELRSDNTRMRANGSTSQDTKGSSNGSTREPSLRPIPGSRDYWNACYAAIDRANKVISYVDVVDDPTLRAQYEGEAKFLRAHLYFNLVRLWGPVFLVTKKTSADEARYMQRSPVEEIYALIEGDLNAIIDHNMLPEQVGGRRPGTRDDARSQGTAGQGLHDPLRGGVGELHEGRRSVTRGAGCCRKSAEQRRSGSPTIRSSRSTTR